MTIGLGFGYGLFLNSETNAHEEKGTGGIHS